MLIVHSHELQHRLPLGIRIDVARRSEQPSYRESASRPGGEKFAVLVKYLVSREAVPAYKHRLGQQSVAAA